MSTTETLGAISRAEAEAAEAAQKAAQAAERARRKAEETRQRAEEARAARLRDYADQLQREWPQARSAAATALGEARADLERAVRGDGDIFACYRRWVQVSIEAWSVDSALAQARDLAGLPARETPVPAFNFAVDVAAIIDRLSLELQDEAVERIRDRRAAFLNGNEG